MDSGASVTFPCPSAPADFHDCSEYSKREDCTTPSPSPSPTPTPPPSPPSGYPDYTQNACGCTCTNYNPPDDFCSRDKCAERCRIANGYSANNPNMHPGTWGLPRMK